MNTYANALEARTHWALHRVSLVAGDDKNTSKELRSALRFAKLSGEMGARADEEMNCPALLIDVQPLRDAFMASFQAVCERRRKLRTRDGIAAELESMAADANRRCGLSYELAVKWFSVDVETLLRELEAPLRPVALEIAKTMDYATPDERKKMQDEIRESGGCSLTGIDPHCCPCGRHE
ncbi:hypothetical protein [Burkholderia pseudomallei]|uniref:Uncharacterized protein n=1 Tax=Burkholderia pseudomallei TaxID=28450 RepID=A0A0C5AYA3_BURPE|nr:hypothetical protein [Burkholderia pseudomallei]AJL34914.1 hypothetical protein pBPS031 [Burkholderia pseudomallei]